MDNLETKENNQTSNPETLNISKPKLSLDELITKRNESRQKETAVVSQKPKLQAIKIPKQKADTQFRPEMILNLETGNLEEEFVDDEILKGVHKKKPNNSFSLDLNKSTAPLKELNENIAAEHLEQPEEKDNVLDTALAVIAMILILVVGIYLAMNPEIVETFLSFI